jgi:16S rRNA (guanine966-N2)-methyltransferase
MRIVSGTLGGRRLKVPRGQDIRPTSDKIRGAIFNSLRSRGAVEGAHVLDGFCGTGALGLEAISQGAASCTFVDCAKNSLELAVENARALGVFGQCKFKFKELAKYGQHIDREEKFSLVFLDPPYKQDLIGPSLMTLKDGQLLADNAIIVVETEEEFEGAFPHPYVLLDERVYGGTKVFYLTYPKALV